MSHSIQSFDEFALIASGYILLVIIGLVFTFKVIRPTMAHKKFLAGLLIIFVPVVSMLFYGLVDPPQNFQESVPVPLVIIMGVSFIATGINIIYRAPDGLDLWRQTHDASKLGAAATPVMPTKANFYFGGGCLIFSGSVILLMLALGVE